MIKLIVTDMDGTLLNKKEEFNREFLDVFKELREKNILFAVASGRQKKNLEIKFSTIKNDLIMLFENGSCGSLNGKILYRTELSKTLVHKLIDTGRKNSHNMLLCTEDMTYIENVNEEFITELKKYYEDITFVNDLKEIEKPIVKFTVFDSLGANDNSYATYKEVVGRKAKMSVSTEKWLHIIKKEASKGYGVQALQSYFNISPEETMVFGDSNNDMEMIKSAKYSYAMHNAIPELKAAANFIAPANDDNGVLEVIKTKVLVKEEKKIIVDPEKQLESILEAAVTTNNEELHEKEIATPTIKQEAKEKVIMVEEKIVSETPSKKNSKKENTKTSETIAKKVSETNDKKSTKTEVATKEDLKDDLDNLDPYEEKHPFDDESLEEKLLAILG